MTHPLNPRVAGLKPSSTLAINEKSNQLIREGKKVYKLGLGQSPFPVPIPVIAALQLHAGEKDYLPVKGLDSLREVVCEFHRKREGVHLSPDRVLIGPGSKELLFLLQLAYDGLLMLPTPCWVSYEPQARIVGKDLGIIETEYENGWKITPGRFELACERSGGVEGGPRILILNYPGNPTGTTYSAEELIELAEVARKYSILVLSDEIYGETEFSGAHVSIARFYPEGTIISSGLSKWCGAGGWRLGTFSSPEELAWLHHAMCAIASETYTSVCAPVQYAAIRAYQGGYEIDRYLLDSRKILKALGTRCAKQLRDAGVKVHDPEGAFYLFLDFSGVTGIEALMSKRHLETSSDLCDAILSDTGVAILPGSDFLRNEDELTARMAFVDFDGSKALTAISALGSDYQVDYEFLRTHCLNVLEAMDALVAWISKNSK